MSLIPSESASFPDLLGRGLGASKNSKWRAPFAEDAAPRDKNKARTAARPSPSSNSIAPVPIQRTVAEPQPVAPPAAVAPKPMEKALSFPGPAARMARLPVNGLTGLTPAKPSVSKAAPVPAGATAPDALRPLHFEPATAAGEPEEFGFPEALAPWPSIKRRRRARLIRFVVYEVFAIALLAASVMTGLSHRATEDPLSVVAKILTIVSAIVVAAVPILFYGIPETLPRSRR